MSITRAKGPRGKADQLFSKIIRSRGECEKCGSTDYLQCAHIVSRRYSATRCDTANALCLCAKCHRYFTDNPVEWAQWVAMGEGLYKYLRLKEKALEGTHRKFGTKFWESEVVRLRALLKDAA